LNHSLEGGNKTLRELQLNEFMARGEDLVVYPVFSPTCEICEFWQGKILSISGTTKGYPSVAEAEVDGFNHPNCRHNGTATIYIPEIFGEPDADGRVQHAGREVEQK